MDAVAENEHDPASREHQQGPVRLFWGLDSKLDAPPGPGWEITSIIDDAEVLCLPEAIRDGNLKALLNNDPLKPVILAGDPLEAVRWQAELREARAVALRVRELHAAVGRTYADDLYRLTLGFAYTRGNRIRARIGTHGIGAIGGTGGERGYGYDCDLALSIAGSGSKTGPLLVSLVASGFLSEHLVEVAHACPTCGSIQLLFRDGCEACASPDVRTVDLVHHFRCGHQGPETLFAGRHGLYICPKCRRELRHFGLDYDKPGDVTVCAACGHTSAQTSVHGRCLSCHAAFPAADAPKLRIFDYTLTGAGMHAVLSGQARMFDPARLLEENLPLMPLDTLFMMARKFAALGNRTVVDTLLMTVFLNRAIAESQTTGEEIRLLVKIGVELVKLIRETDTAAYDRGNLYLLMPAASHDDAEAVQTRMMNALQPVFDAAILDRLIWRAEAVEDFLASAAAPGP
jgi:DNA-directed RNA polymerase subunit RPC12/RpoP